MVIRLWPYITMISTPPHLPLNVQLTFSTEPASTVIYPTLTHTERFLPLPKLSSKGVSTIW